MWKNNNKKRWNFAATSFQHVSIVAKWPRTGQKIEDLLLMWTEMDENTQSSIVQDNT